MDMGDMSTRSGGEAGVGRVKVASPDQTSTRVALGKHSIKTT